jgi:hypothetical protein
MGGLETLHPAAQVMAVIAVSAVVIIMAALIFNHFG